MNGPVERFVITDLRIPFFRLVLFFVKAALAAIPAAIIVGFLIMLVTAIIAAIFGGGSMDYMMGRWRL
jgi:VIT1/CCC1 family predicted Fe2+/Mn2+ transporter